MRNWYCAREAVIKERRSKKEEGRIRSGINLQEEHKKEKGRRIYA
jgi:hypothetical protein